MKLSRDRIGALFFLCAAVGYYLMAGGIELYPGDEYEPITARTFPKVIGAVGAVLSLLIIVLPGKGDEGPVGWAGLDWGRGALLCGLMVAYGLTIKWPGFFLATSAFLIAGFLVLGERRIWVLSLASLPVAAGFEFVLDGLLDIFIEDPFLAWLGIKGS